MLVVINFDHGLEWLKLREQNSFDLIHMLNTGKLVQSAFKNFMFSLGAIAFKYLVNIIPSFFTSYLDKW